MLALVFTRALSYSVCNHRSSTGFDNAKTRIRSKRRIATNGDAWIFATAKNKGFIQVIISATRMALVWAIHFNEAQ
jgi:hypothetical protein